MRIARFVGKKVHGVLDFNIKFNTDITFLTGINGSGKTTIVNCVVALMTPSLQSLANIEYDSIRVEFRGGHEKDLFFIDATKENNLVHLRVTAIDRPMSFPIFVAEIGPASMREADSELEYYKNVLSNLSNHEVLRFVGSIPTPMFLGLDRRARFVDDSDRRRFWPPAAPRLGRKGNSVSLTRSLSDAASLAENSNRDMLIAVGRVGDRLRKTLILELLTTEPSNPQEGKLGFQLQSPSDEEIGKIETVDKTLKDLHVILGLSKHDVDSRIGPFLTSIKRGADILKRYSKRVEKDPGNDVNYFNALVGWALNAPQLRRILSMSQKLASYNDEIEAFAAKFDTYLRLVNKFLSDSRKTVRFDERGYIHYTFGNSRDQHDLGTLSSGEAQIFVILTHLALNPQVQNDNVLIIDEPELSLHVQWQELFVESIISANPDVQYIMATHAPSIILDRTHKCVDISKRVASR